MTAATRWTIAIVGILTVTIGSGVTLAVVAHTSARSQVVPDYYGKSLRYDTDIADVEASRATGWRATAEFTKAGLVFCLDDREGRPVQAQVTATGYHRAHANQSIERTLNVGSTGCYQTTFGELAGWYDVKIRATQGVQRFVATAALESP